MSDDLKFQLRLTLSDEFAQVARNVPGDPSISTLTDILKRHDAVMKCQFDAFADYVSEAEANGIENFRTITPMLLAKRFTLNPVLVIISLVFWFWMWGAPGAILSVPMLAITKIICDRVRPLDCIWTLSGRMTAIHLRVDWAGHPGA